jgi:hypothetical protein
MIVPLIKWNYAPPGSRKWQEHVSHDCAAREMKYAPTEWREHVSHDYHVAHEIEIRTA